MVLVGAATGLGLVAVGVVGLLAGEVPEGFSAGFSGFSALGLVAAGVLGFTVVGDLVSTPTLDTSNGQCKNVPVVVFGLVDVGVLAVGLTAVGVLGFSAGLVVVAAAGLSDCSFFKVSFSS